MCLLHVDVVADKFDWQGQISWARITVSGFNVHGPQSQWDFDLSLQLASSTNSRGSRITMFVPLFHTSSILILTRLFFIEKLWIIAVSFSSDSRWVVATSLNHNLYILDARSGAWVCTLEAHSDSVWVADFSPGRNIVSGGPGPLCGGCGGMSPSSKFRLCVP